MSEWCRLFAQFEMLVSFLLAERVGFLAYLSGADQPPTTSLTLVATAAVAGVWVDPSQGGEKFLFLEFIISDWCLVCQTAV